MSVLCYTLYYKSGKTLKEIAQFDASDDLDASKKAAVAYNKYCDDRGFKIYYTRCWNTDKETIFDVGSHTEFFVLYPKISLGNLFFEPETEMRYTIEDRDRVLFGNEDATRHVIGGLKYFDDVGVDTLKWLVANGFLSPGDCQNDSPSAREFIEFMESHPTFVANGYATCKARPDCRVTITGLSAPRVSREDIIDFSDKFNDADEFSVSHGTAYCWYD